MFDHDTHTLSGPDFLDAVADAELAMGNEVNADVYRSRARQWRDDQRALEAATAALGPPRRRTSPTTAIRNPITPTNSRN